MNLTQAEMFVVTGMADMVEKDGKTPHQVIERVREIEQDIFFALMELKGERDSK